MRNPITAELLRSATPKSATTASRGWEVGVPAIVGGTKKVKLDVIHELKPDLIFAEKEENTKEMVEELEKHYPVFVAEVQSVNEAYRMIHDFGVLNYRVDKSNRFVN
ncbi:helical backbone metal receptor, partial [Streptomyces nojiriensis]|uniref:helical backbone metal receptor n=1 Tax=Streptomyces nojiriensis TaxID=66374 RepID=UPI0035D94265